MTIYENVDHITMTEMNSYINSYINSDNEETQDSFIRSYKFNHHYAFKDRESIYNFKGYLDIMSNLLVAFPFSFTTMLNTFYFINIPDDLTEILSKDKLVSILSSSLTSEYQIKELTDVVSVIEDNGYPLMLLFSISDNKYMISYISDPVLIKGFYPKYYRDLLTKVTVFFDNLFISLIEEQLDVYEYAYTVKGA